MGCNPKPETTCGTTIPETCVTIVDNTIFSSCPAWVLANIGINVNDCYRQSDFNQIFAGSICSVFTTLGQMQTCAPAPVTTGSGILGAITTNCLANCSVFVFPTVFPLVTTPVKNGIQVKEELQNIYNDICRLNGVVSNLGEIPLSTLDLTIPTCIAPACCDDPMLTLKDLLNAIMAKMCCIVNNAVDAQGNTLNSLGGACPDCTA